MFAELETIRGEYMFVNLAELLYVYAGKKGGVIVMNDGSIYELKETYEELKAMIFSAILSDCEVID